jgi:hypothetical protein
MSQTATYFTAAVPEPVRVLGLELKPFSLGHFITLNRFGSAFVSEGDFTADLKDKDQLKALRAEIIFAAVICHFPFNDFYEFIRQKDFLPQLRKLGREVGLFSVKEKAKLLQDYIKEASEMPGYVMEDEPGKSGAHWAHTVLASAVSHCGYARDEALNAPLRQVLWDFMKHAESNGAVTLLSEQEMEQIASLN